MILIPAIDLINGQCVRLTKGDYSTKKIYSSDPVQQAKTFADQGAQYLHIVDLDGAKSGQTPNLRLIQKIRKSIQIPIQVGGGIRTLATARTYFKNGIDRIIIGTQAVKKPKLIYQLIEEFGPDRIIISLDIRNQKIATDGWKESTPIPYLEFATQLKTFGITQIIATDISRDGTLTEPNFDLYKNLINLNLQVTASGGISKPQDLNRLKKIGCSAAIIGKALYEQKLSLPKLLATSPNPLTKRIIPCLDIKSGRVVKGTNFKNLQDSGDPIELAKLYATQGADELIFLDITATNQKRKTLTNLVTQISKEIFIPFTVGGGITTVEDIRSLLQAGADKVAINSAAIKNPALIRQASKTFGSQCITVAIDYDSNQKVYINAGQTPINLNVVTWAQQAASLGAGELLLTSISRDGTKEGFDCQSISQISQSVPIPVIASGGAGTSEDFAAVFTYGQADAALAASIFHNQELKIPDLKSFLISKKIPIRPPAPCLPSTPLTPTIIQDAETSQVLMLGYMTPESLAKTIQTQKVTFFSRSKNRLWTKGETSGNFLQVIAIQKDCDQDALLIKALPQGPTCHTGKTSCFDPDFNSDNPIQALFNTIALRTKNLPKKSYTASLIKSGLDRICTKIAEESGEVIKAATKETNERLTEESIDLIYHLFVLLSSKKITWQQLTIEIQKRSK